MTPTARIAAAIEVLDRILGGTAAERALTNWARGARYAGSKDRAAVRDWVFDALRRRRSCAWLGGAETGRGLILGALRFQGADPSAVFGAGGYAPAALGPGDGPGKPLTEAPAAVKADLPDWAWDRLVAQYGAEATAIAQALQDRAPVGVRANRLKATREQAMSALEADGFAVTPHPLADTALVLDGPGRGLTQSKAYRQGVVELQDPASQAVVGWLPKAARVLDYCAGGGGKSLALAAEGVEVFAHDVSPQRMRDIPERAKRAGCTITCVAPDEIAALAPFDLVLCDAPCSGSGAWRRSPDGKWRLEDGDLAELALTQRNIMQHAARFVGRGGALAYATCSLFSEENQEVVAKFIEADDSWTCVFERQLTPLDGGDGFYLAILEQKGVAESRGADEALTLG